MQLVIISGYSGAGKSLAASILEDCGYYCVDNMPAELIPQFVQVCLATKAQYEKVALVTDIRGGLNFDGLFAALDQLDAIEQTYRILFIEAESDVIIQRYKENRRKHPLSRLGGTLPEIVERERQLLQPVRNRANHVIDTSYMSPIKLRGYVMEAVAGHTKDLAMNVNVISFGFKYGIPRDADLVFDVRFLPNPFYISELKEKTGLDKEVRDFIFSYRQTENYVQRLISLIDFSLPYYAEEGKTGLVIAIGCTGGKHRSVALAREIADHISQLGYQTVANHRDMGRR